jgi:hypothetical protein
MTLLAPVTVFVDSSGTPLFTPGENPHPYVAAAVAIAASDHENVIALLPRETDGSPMKASSASLDDDVAADFLSKLFQLRASVTFVAVDANDPENCKIAEKSLTRANENRRKGISLTSWMNLLTAKEAISTIWQYSPIDGGQIGFFDVVLHRESLPERERKLFKSIVKSSFERKGRGSRVGGLSWKSLQEEPMLYVPDLAAGIFRRWSACQDVKRARGEILKAEAQGKVFIVNGFDLLDLED